MTRRWRTVETEAGAARLEADSPEGVRVYRGRFAGDDAIGSITVDGLEHGDPTWTWWTGDRTDQDGIGSAASEEEAVAALLRYTALRDGL
jgi:hypothetical protein